MRVQKFCVTKHQKYNYVVNIFINEYKSGLGMHKTQCINFKYDFSFPSSTGLTGKMANSSHNDSVSLKPLVCQVTSFII